LHNIHLDQFEGPLDLLLYFIRKDEIDIYDIPISKITYDYFNVIDKMNSLNVSIAGEFVLMAATLMKIKSKILIPRQELDEEGEIVDPRTDLVNKLIEYQQFKNVSDKLRMLQDEADLSYTRRLLEDSSFEKSEKMSYDDLTLFNLAELFKKAIEKAPLVNPIELRAEPISLESRKKLILSSFDGNGKLSFFNLILNLKDKLDIIISFLAILDLIRTKQILVFQKNVFSDIEFNLLTIE
tara:strand:- start:12592 stop:13308 length:717 start_codon:yes stop_codon:yes gene_type:complete